MDEHRLARARPTRPTGNRPPCIWIARDKPPCSRPQVLRKPRAHLPLTAVRTSIPDLGLEGPSIFGCRRSGARAPRDIPGPPGMRQSENAGAGRSTDPNRSSRHPARPPASRRCWFYPEVSDWKPVRTLNDRLPAGLAGGVFAPGRPRGFASRGIAAEGLSRESSGTCGASCRVRGPRRSPHRSTVSASSGQHNDPDVSKRDPSWARRLDSPPGRSTRALSIFERPYMGTSVEMIDRTYGHLAKGAEDSARAKLDAYASRTVTGFGNVPDECVPAP